MPQLEIYVEFCHVTSRFYLRERIHELVSELRGDVNPNPGPIIPQNHHEDEFHIIPGNGLKIGQTGMST